MDAWSLHKSTCSPPTLGLQVLRLPSLAVLPLGHLPGSNLHSSLAQIDIVRRLMHCPCKVQSGASAGHPSPACHKDDELSNQGVHLSGNEGSSISRLEHQPWFLMRS